MKNVEESVSLGLAEKSAQEELKKRDESLEKNRDEIREKLKKNPRDRLIGAMIGTFLLIGFCIYLLIEGKAFMQDGGVAKGSYPFVFGTLGVFLVLCILVMIDEGRIMKTQNRIGEIYRRAMWIGQQFDQAKSNISQDTQAFLASRSGGWNVPLQIGESLSQDSDEVESDLAAVKEQKEFLKNVKVFLLYLLNCTFTITGFLFLQETAENIIPIEDEDGNAAVKYVVLVISVVAGIVLTRLVWSHYGKVNNLTILVALTGPLIFILLVYVAWFLVKLITILIKVLVVLGAIALAIASSSGG